MAPPFGISPRKTMAMGGKMPTSMPATGPGDFGISTDLGGKVPVPHPDRDHMPSHMGDGERAAPPPIKHPKRGNMHNQANPDHGPHNWC